MVVIGALVFATCIFPMFGKAVCVFMLAWAVDGLLIFFFFYSKLIINYELLYQQSNDIGYGVVTMVAGFCFGFPKG